MPREAMDAPPPPEWKHRDYIRDILPADDPHRDEVRTRAPGRIAGGRLDRALGQQANSATSWI